MLDACWPALAAAVAWRWWARRASGKTHLAHGMGRARPKATVLNAACADIARAYDGPVLMENAERAHPDTLFHLINIAPSGGGLLLTSRLHPRTWPADLPDLRSRLNAMHVAEIGTPDDLLLEGLLRKFFRERNIKPAEDVYPYPIRRIERSVRMAPARLCARLDEACRTLKTARSLRRAGAANSRGGVDAL